MKFDGLIQIKNGQPVTTSIKVANVFGKNNRDINRKIRNLVAQNCAARPMFSESHFVNRGRNYSMFYMNKDGFSLLVMGFTGTLAEHFKIEYIHAFDEMERELRDPVQAEAKRMVKDPLSVIEQAVGIAKKYRNDHIRYQKTMNNPQLISTSVIAKDIGMSAKTLNLILNQKHVIFRRGGSWTLYSRYQNKGYAKYRYYDNEFYKPLLKWTQKGRQFIYDLLGIYPLQQMNLLGGDDFE